MNRPDPVYLDYAATAPIRPQAQAAAVCALGIGGNPSSVHARGRTARSAVERARAQVAALSGAAPDAVVFTSGGTEANRLAVEGAVAAGCSRPIVLATEHASVLRPALAGGGWTEMWPVDAQGLAQLDWLADRLRRWDRADGAPFVALALANSETGVIQDVAAAAALVHAAGGTVHVDAVQALGKIDVDVRPLGADTLALSGHKIGAPQGIGALITTPRARFGPRVEAGAQERGLRPGTENVAGIAAFGAAAEAAAEDVAMGEPLQAPWRDRAAERLKAEGAMVVGERAPRLPGVLCAVSEGFSSEMQVMALDLEGVMVSAGSACGSGKVHASGVLTAMGVDRRLAGEAVRASGGWATAAADWERFAEVWVAARTRQVNRRRVA